MNPTAGDTGEQEKRRRIELVPDEAPVTVPVPQTEPA